MIPQVLQSLYGYRAIDAGLVLGPGAFVITLLAPVGAQLIQRGIIHPRVLVAISLVIVSASMLYYSGFTLQTDYSHYALARAFQGLGYAFFFVPVSVIAYSQLKPNQNNRASSLTNLFRNWGGSFGIAFITTVSERRQNFHQSVVGANLTPSSPGLQEYVHKTAAYLAQHGYSQADSVKAAYLYYYTQLEQQTRLLGFMDCFRIIGWVTLAMVPLVFFIRHFHVSGKPSGGH
jgi:DHA2 family multidrug resistance protein